MKRTVFMTRYNTQLRTTCSNSSGATFDICKEPDFLQQACGRFPTLLSKVVRLRLASIKSLLNDPQLDGMKIIYLVRDPRGIITWLVLLAVSHEIFNNIQAFDNRNIELSSQNLRTKMQILSGLYQSPTSLRRSFARFRYF